MTPSITSGRARILIYEHDHGGHRFTGVRVLLEALLELDERHDALASITLATTREALDSAEFATQLGPLANTFDVRAERDTLRAGRRAFDSALGRLHAFEAGLEKLRTLKAMLAGGGVDHLYVPYGDGLLQLLALQRITLRRDPWPASVAAETIMMRTGFAYPGTPVPIRRLGLLALSRSPFTRVHLIDPYARCTLARAHPALLARTALLPDPITPTPPRERRAARRTLGLPPDGRLVGLVGRIDERKGADSLVEAFCRAPLGADDRLLLAGRQSAGMRAMLSRLSDPRVVALDRYIAEDELIDAIAALDLVAAPYPAFNGSASIVIRAATAGRPCLANDTGWMGYVVPRFGLGTVCDVRDRAAFAAALVTALDASSHYAPDGDAQRFVDYGSAANIRAHWTAELRRRLALPQDPALRPWPEAPDPSGSSEQATDA